MPLAKSKNSVGLGNTLMNDRFGKGKGSDRRRGGAITRTNHATGEQYITNDHTEAGWVKMRSITEQGALDEFLATAQLAGTDFTAQKMNNVKIIHTDQKNPYLLTAAEERAALRRHKENRERLTVPRRPAWDASTTPEALDVAERESFLVWRRGLAELQDNQDLLMTPFERNLEVWRQLWRVIERSDLVVQIVDARNPLLFRSADLEDYVKDVDGGKKQNLLLINKADMMTDAQRRAWAEHLTKAKIAYKFFSAHLAKEQNELRELEEEGRAEGDEATGERVESSSSAAAAPTKAKAIDSEDEDETSGGGAKIDGEEASEEDEDDEEDEDEEEEETGEATASDEEYDTRILTVEELESLFLQYAPKTDDPDRKLQVGLVGYPNVGKSSTINALIGAKKVSVSSTPGKTKHFQTIHLSDRVVLCDCPGLVFPNFATTKADLVCNGILPIDQLREFSGPAGLVARRIPQPFLEAVYGIRIRTRPVEEGGTGVPTAEELLSAYAKARGFTRTTGLGQPDEARAARYILKDYVNGKLLWVAPPPGAEIDPAQFNRALYNTAHLPEKRRLQLLAAAAAANAASAHAAGAAAAGSLHTLSLAEEDESGSDDDGGDEAEGDDAAAAISLADTADMVALPAGPKSQRLDKQFFKATSTGNAGHLNMPFSHKYSEQGRAAAASSTTTGSGKQLSGRKARLMVALENGLDPEEAAQALAGTKKHFKGGAKGRGKKKKGPGSAADE